MKLTQRQSNELGRFFLDLGKGIAVGIFGLIFISNIQPWTAYYFIIISGLAVIFCVRIGLRLIK